MLSEQIQKDAWYKLWGNMTVNPVSAITGATTDLILDDELVRGFISSVMLEAREIGARIGIPIAQTPEDRHQVTRKLGAFKTSMLQDVEAGKPVETRCAGDGGQGTGRADRRADAVHRCAAGPVAAARAGARPVLMRRDDDRPHLRPSHRARRRAAQPRTLHEALPCAEPQAAFIARSREAVRRILRGEDDRLLVIVGPCSIHDPQAAVEYATRLREAATQRQDTLLPVMRVYFEKPRTRMGWKGLIYDPDLDGAGDIAKGLRAARGLLLECAAQGVPAASEILDLVTPQYYAELLSWGAIGARTVESPLHRQMASALSAPVGFKNATHGGIDVAIDAIHVAQQAHRFPSITHGGRAPSWSAPPATPTGTWCCVERTAGPTTTQPAWPRPRGARKRGARAAPADRLQPRQQRQGLPAPAARWRRKWRRRWPAAARPSRACCWKATSSKASRRS